MSPASGVPGECFQLGEADEVIIEENIDIPEIDDGGNNKITLFSRIHFNFTFFSKTQA